MTRAQLILELTERLKKLPKADREKAIEYYLESIDDRIDDGMREEEAVAALGSLDDITAKILEDIPLTKLAAESLKQKKLAPGILVLLIVGSPLWISLLAAALSVIVAVYACALAVVVSLFAASVALGVCAPVVLLLGIQMAIKSGIGLALVYWGMALAFAGLGIFLWIGGHYTVKGCIRGSKQFWSWVKSLIVRKEAAK